MTPEDILMELREIKAMTAGTSNFTHALIYRLAHLLEMHLIPEVKP